MDITGAKCMIGNQNLQFTNASQLNDPFDCHPKLLDYSSVPERKLQGWIPEEWWKMKEENDALNLRNETWLCSLSKINDSILMWAHYCYNHKGICIGLDLDKIMESVPPMFGSIYIKLLSLMFNIIISSNVQVHIIQHRIFSITNGKQKRRNGNMSRRSD